MSRTCCGNSAAACRAVVVGRKRWCCVAYWELQKRVGPLFYADHEDGVLVCQKRTPPAYSDGAGCFQLPADSRNLDKFRSRFLDGIRLERERKDGERVWLYNLTELPLFLTSNCWQQQDETSLLGRPKLDSESRQAVKVLPLCRLLVYKSDARPKDHDKVPSSRPTVKISIGKGWGDGFTRLHITCCPCWLEVMFERTEDVLR